MNFTKMQGAGNDFIVVKSSGIEYDWPKMAKAMCDRHYGIGADGLLVVSNSGIADIYMRTFNADGSEANACGNGLRCVVKYVVDSGLAGIGTEQVSVETVSGIRRAKLYKTGNKLADIQVRMGEPKFRAEDIPVSVEQDRGGELDIIPILDYPITVTGMKLLLSFVSMGNPHAIHFLPYVVADFPLSQIGPEVQRLGIFPDGVNFEIAHIMPTSPQQIEVRVWERGVGETLACGSGACAVAVIARLHGHINTRKVSMKLPGGKLEVAWDGAGEVLLSGPAQMVFTGEWSSKIR